MLLTPLFFGVSWSHLQAGPVEDFEQLDRQFTVRHDKDEYKDAEAIARKMLAIAEGPLAWPTSVHGPRTLPTRVRLRVR